MVSFKEIENKWQNKWSENNAFKAKDDSEKEKYYVLEMFPYPSGSGLHMGHALNYVIGDIFARFKRMYGYNVLYPMGYDALGLPAENAAIKADAHPKDYTEKSIKCFEEQQRSLGLSYDWSRELATMDPEYYKWNQYFFLKFYENGLVYRRKSPVNWCPKCNTVLANEQVQNGKCWRHDDTDIEIKHLYQWFLKTTAYAEELLNNIDKLEWPERIKTMQRNWIGKSEGTEINFEVEKPNGEKIKWPIFTTRPDTIFGVTFMVIAAQHPDLKEFVTEDKKEEVDNFLKKTGSVSEKEMEELEKEGVFTGSYAINPANGERVPIYAGNFVVAEYGGGMVMAVPAHDQRDFEFAKKYDIPIRIVIQPETFEINPERMSRAYTAEGRLVNSGDFDGWSNHNAIEAISEWLEKEDKGKKTTNYKLRDWGFSRQRYWGTPIPMIYCEDCGLVPVPEKDLPVEIPYDVEFGKGNPLETNEEWIKTSCPKCGKDARRETETMDTFFDSSWYFLRYCDNKNPEKPFSKENAEYWMPVDQYIGGAEHACMHLIYARFFTKALRDLGFVNINEPFTRLFNQGMLLGPDGEKMSKSKGNVVTPESVSENYGIDTARLFLVSVAKPDKDIQWSDKEVKSTLNFIERVFEHFKNVKLGESSEKVQHKINKTLKNLTEDIENFDYNLASIKLRKLFESLEGEEISKEDAEKFIKMLAPFCPHITEELWEWIGNSGEFVSLSEWPGVDESKINEEVDKREEEIEKLGDDINNIVKIMKEKQNKEPGKAYVYVLPQEKDNLNYEKDNLEKKTNLEITIHAVNDEDKYDPEEKSKKVKPGKPGIYLE